MAVDDNFINVDSEEGKELGFTSDRFRADNWLSKYKDNLIIISQIDSLEPEKGHFSELLKRIEEQGSGVLVPEPSRTMRVILTNKGYIARIFDWEKYGLIEIMLKKETLEGMTKDGVIEKVIEEETEKIYRVP